jgi:hypothetical protein
MPFVTYKCSAEILSGKSVYKHASSGYIESVDTNVFVSRFGGTATEVPSYVDLIMRDNYQIYVGDIVCQMTSYDNSSKHFRFVAYSNASHYYTLLAWAAPQDSFGTVARLAPDIT